MGYRFIKNKTKMHNNKTEAVFFLKVEGLIPLSKGKVCGGNGERKARESPVTWQCGDRGARETAEIAPGARSGFSRARFTPARWVAVAGPGGRHPTGRHLPGPPAAPPPGRDTRRAEQPITRNPSAGTRRRATRAQGQASRAARRLRPAAPQGTPACRPAASLPGRPRR